MHRCMDDLPITDPASALVGLGALVGLLASWSWMKAWAALRSTGEGRERVSAAALDTPAFLTSITLAFLSAGYLLGRFTGRF